ncbi:hypothetical protein [Paenarthrobacter sp. AB444]|uniref:hypothetical protein n=1 Tax=Paenarthrobacter sp. AB444 TaxID=3025681 RepID=UPI0023650C93|nr:hypothetical protein [Paenarthrobacter sp. AB444]MDD7835662.1 hypothetical protein [Paenarthrobacter sp. AB444]
MSGSRVFPRAASILRSVMVAGAGTAIWMALSATAADANTGSDKNLLDSVTSSSSITVPVPNVPLPASVKGLLPADLVNVPVPAVTPVVQHVAGAVDDAVGAVPVANQILPANTAGTIVNTVVTPVTDPVDQTVNVVVPPVNSLVEPVRLEPVTDAVNPVVEPIVGVVDTVLPPLDTVVPPITIPPVVVPPVTVPDSDLPGIPGADASVAPASPDAGTEPSAGVESSPEPTGSSLAVQAEQSSEAGLSVDASWLANTRNFGPTGITAVLGGSSPVADPAAPSGLPGDFDALPSGLAGSGSGASSNGPPNPAAAFLHDALIIPADALPGLATASDEQHPKPVSFDPGSSPD